MKKIETISPDRLISQGYIDEAVISVKRDILDAVDNCEETHLGGGLSPDCLWEYFTCWGTSRIASSCLDFDVDCETIVTPHWVLRKYQEALRKHGVRSRISREEYLTFEYDGYVFRIEPRIVLNFNKDEMSVCDANVTAKKGGIEYRYSTWAGSARAILALGRILETSRPYVARLERYMRAKRIEKKILEVSRLHSA